MGSKSPSILETIPAEVHTYARATVNKGFLYVADLDAHKSTNPSIADACKAQLMLESLDEPPLDPTDGPDTRSCSPDCGSPIVIDLDRGGFTFTNLDGGVQFDLTPGGSVEETAWTETGSEDGFLVLDRNEHGSIDDGSDSSEMRLRNPPRTSPTVSCARRFRYSDGRGQ